MELAASSTSRLASPPRRRRSTPRRPWSRRASSSRAPGPRAGAPSRSTMRGRAPTSPTRSSSMSRSSPLHPHLRRRRLSTSSASPSRPWRLRFQSRLHPLSRHVATRQRRRTAAQGCAGSSRPGMSQPGRPRAASRGAHLAPVRGRSEVRGGDGSGRWWEAEDGAMGRRRISATARRPALAATHQRASQARQRRPSGAAAAAAPGAAAAPSRRGDGGLQARRRRPPGAEAAGDRRGGGGRLARGTAGVGAPPNPSPSRPLGHWLLGRPERPDRPRRPARHPLPPWTQSGGGPKSRLSRPTAQ